MAIRQVWRCSDGAVFSEHADAERHENALGRVTAYNKVGEECNLWELKEAVTVVNCENDTGFEKFIHEVNNSDDEINVVGWGAGIYLWAEDNDGDDIFIKLPQATKNCISKLFEKDEVF